MIAAQLKLSRGDFALDADFTIPSTGITAVYGPSGAGKTTLLRAIAGLETATGTLRVGAEIWQDADVNMPVHERAVGFVFQEASLFAHLNVRGNLEFGWHRSERTPIVDRDAAIDLLGLEALLHKMPDELSGGERKRVAIGRALLRRPRLMLLDEPLASLDLHHQHELLPFLEKLPAATQLPIVMVSHAPEEVARLADHLLLMEKGSITAGGSLQEVLTRLDLPVAHTPDAAAIIAAEPGDYDKQFDLTSLNFSGGPLQVAGRVTSHSARVRILARDVSLALSKQQDTSILNIIAATVTDIDEDLPGQALVKLDAGGTALLSRITRKSMQALDIRPGLGVYAQIKSVALLAP